MKRNKFVSIETAERCAALSAEGRMFRAPIFTTVSNQDLVLHSCFRRQFYRSVSSHTCAAQYSDALQSALWPFFQCHRWHATSQ